MKHKLLSILTLLILSASLIGAQAEWDSSLNETGQQAQIVEESVSNISIGDEGEANFDGLIRAETPCHTLNKTVEEQEEGVFVLDLETVPEEDSELCAQQTVMIEYNASFYLEEDYKLEVLHNGDLIDSMDSEEGEIEITSDRSTSTSSIESVVDWFRDLF